MSATPPSGASVEARSLAARVKGILLEPRTEWGIIEAEPATFGSILRYVLILAAIPPIGSATGLSLTGDFHTNGLWLVQIAIASYAKTVIIVYMLALTIDALAPTFGSQKGRLAALKVAAYSATAVWVAGILFVSPTLGRVASMVAALYSIYLLYRGLPVLMKSPSSQAMPYTVMTVAAGFVVSIAVGFLYGQLFALLSAFAFYHGSRFQ